jgi:hypothetical protein
MGSGIRKAWAKAEISGLTPDEMGFLVHGKARRENKWTKKIKDNCSGR